MNKLRLLFCVLVGIGPTAWVLARCDGPYGKCPRNATLYILKYSDTWTCCDGDHYCPLGRPKQFTKVAYEAWYLDYFTGLETTCDAKPLSVTYNGCCPPTGGSTGIGP